MNYEDKKQELIVRQSTLERAIEYLQTQNKPITPLVLLSTADLFKQYIFEGLSTNVKDRCKKMEEFL